MRCSMLRIKDPSPFSLPVFFEGGAPGRSLPPPPPCAKPPPLSPSRAETNSTSASNPPLERSTKPRDFRCICKHLRMSGRVQGWPMTGGIRDGDGRRERGQTGMKRIAIEGRESRGNGMGPGPRGMAAPGRTSERCNHSTIAAVRGSRHEGRLAVGVTCLFVDAVESCDSRRPIEPATLRMFCEDTIPLTASATRATSPTRQGGPNHHHP